MEKKGRGIWRRRLVLVTDILFVMLLCFAVLLVTMLAQNGFGTAAGDGYHIVPATLAAVVLALGAYLVCLLRKSERELTARLKTRREGGEAE